ncbi:PaaI family thioesterase [Sediminimonas qiaohouensis]|uniref:PaaI family thioesterase n=1 Tax=Sediminimonas qiaohouensis TaxID=552061 RepID=UPI00041BD193|nr:PaaI family thioesterase [Sediminimonas qiaohouensis]
MAEVTKQEMAQIARLWNARGKGLITHMALDIEDVSRDGVRVRMPFNPDFCIDEDQTLLHGGILTALLDSVFGLANFVAIEGISTMATLDLRVDYLRAARSRADVIVRAHCFRQTRHIAFNAGSIWFDGHEEAEIARGTASFALTRGETGLFGAMTEGDAS